jgi:hypothetical protein
MFGRGLLQLGFWIRRHPFLTGLILFFAAWAYVQITAPPAPILTPGQQQLLQEARAAEAAKQAEEAAKSAEEGAYKNELCHWAAACKKYGTFRLDCAVAGDFNTCIQIKMGRDARLVSVCTDDGRLSSPPKDMPTLSECFFRNLVNGN